MRRKRGPRLTSAAVPWTITPRRWLHASVYASTATATRGLASRFRALPAALPDPKQILPSSSTWQTGTTCGRPRASAVATRHTRSRRMNSATVLVSRTGSPARGRPAGELDLRLLARRQQPALPGVVALRLEQLAGDLLAVLRELQRIGADTLEGLQDVVPQGRLDGIAHLPRRRPERRLRRLGRQAVRRRRPGEEGRGARLVPLLLGQRLQVAAAPRLGGEGARPREGDGLRLLPLDRVAHLVLDGGQERWPDLSRPRGGRLLQVFGEELGPNLGRDVLHRLPTAFADLEHLDHVEAELGADRRRRHLTLREREGRRLELRDDLALGDPAEVAASRGRARVLRELLGEFSKVLTRPGPPDQVGR